MDGQAPRAAAALILAAGGGSRYGMPKALIRWGDGRLLVDRAVAVAREAGCDPILVVLGAAAGTVRAEAELSGVRVVDNPAWRTGMGSSLRAGLSALVDTDAGAVVVLLVDMPGVTPAAIARVARNADPGALRAASYGGVRGHPVLLGRAHWAGARAAAGGDSGARAYLRDHADQIVAVPCGDIADGADLDVPPQPRDGCDAGEDQRHAGRT